MAKKIGKLLDRVYSESRVKEENTEEYYQKKVEFHII